MVRPGWRLAATIPSLRVAGLWRTRTESQSGNGRPRFTCRHTPSTRHDRAPGCSVQSIGRIGWAGISSGYGRLLKDLQEKIRMSGATKRPLPSVYRSMKSIGFAGICAIECRKTGSSPDRAWLLGDYMKMMVTGAAMLMGLALAVPAGAAPGQCSMTGYDTFQCDVTVDGGGLTMGLPDGRTFVFVHEADGEGLGFLIAADARPGQSPQELGRFSPVEGEPGCWVGAKDETRFCAAVQQ